MSAWDAIPEWTPADHVAEHPLEAVYIRTVMFGTPDEAHRLVRAPVIGWDTRDGEPVVTDPATSEPVRAADSLLVDAGCLYLGTYDAGRQPSWAAIEGAKAILDDRGIKEKKRSGEIR